MTSGIVWVYTVIVLLVVIAIQFIDIHTLYKIDNFKMKLIRIFLSYNSNIVLHNMYNKRVPW